jgi:hypothetical protein
VRPALRYHRRVVLGLGFFALLFTLPLLYFLTTHVPGDGIDDPSLAWNLWWLHERLVVQLNADIFHVNWLFSPIQINLAFYTLTPLNGLLSIPLQEAFGLVVANNLLLLSSFFLSGYGAFLLAKDLLRRFASSGDGRWETGAAAVAAAIYAFSSAKLFYAALGQFNIASSQWIPFAVLYLLRTAEATTLREARRYGLLAGFFLAFQLASELTFASFLLLFWALLILWRLGELWQQRGLRTGLPPLVVGNAVAAALFLLALAPFLAAMAPDLAAEGNFFGAGGGFADLFSADLLGYLMPVRLNPFFGSLAQGMAFPNDKGQHIYVGYVAGFLAWVGFAVLMRRPGAPRRSGCFWGVVTLFFFALTLGPLVRWNGVDTALPGPFALVSQLPFFSGNRYPSRYSVMLLLGVGMLAAAGVWGLLHRGDSRPVRNLLFGLLLAGFMAEQVMIPLPISDLRIPAIYRELAALPGDGVLLELPTGWRNGARVMGRSDLLIMLQQWYQTAHGKRRLGGNTSRNPPYKFDYFSQAPLLGTLIALMNSDQPHLKAYFEQHLTRLIADERPLARQVLADLGIGYVTIHDDKVTAEMERYVAQVLPLARLDTQFDSEARFDAGTVSLHQVTAPAPTTARTILFDDAMGALYLGEGWSALPALGGGRYALRPSPVLLLPLPAAGGVIRIAGDPAVAGVQVNGVTLAATGIQFRLPPGVASEPMDRVVLTLAGSGVPAGADGAGDPIGVGRTGSTLPGGTALVVRSAGEEVGDAAHIWFNGVDVAPNQRGYNLAAISPQGELLGVDVFDTFAEASESDRLAAWVAQWPAGTILAGAVADEASTQLQPPAVAALHTAGVAEELAGRFRWSHAFIGVVGAPAGTAVEATGLIRPVAVAAGAPVDGVASWGVIHAVTVEPAGG